MKSAASGINSQKLFEVRIGRFSWRVDLTDDEFILRKDDSVFNFCHIFVRKALPIEKRNNLIVDELTKALLVDADYFHMVKDVLDTDEKLIAFVHSIAIRLTDLLIDKSVSGLLRTQTRKERYRKKIRSGHIPKKQLKLKFFTEAA